MDIQYFTLEELLTKLDEQKNTYLDVTMKVMEAVIPKIKK